LKTLQNEEEDRKSALEMARPWFPVEKRVNGMSKLEELEVFNDALVGVAPSEIRPFRDRNAFGACGWRGVHAPGSSAPDVLIIVDGFLLFNRKDVRDLFDVELMLRASRTTVKSRGARRPEYTGVKIITKSPACSGFPFPFWQGKIPQPFCLSSRNS
jgi:hypothetical protein